MHKTALIGFEDNDPYALLINFLESCEVFKVNRVSEDVIHLHLFLLSELGGAKQWLNSLPQGSITN